MTETNSPMVEEVMSVPEPSRNVPADGVGLASVRRINAGPLLHKITSILQTPRPKNNKNAPGEPRAQ